MNEFWNLDEVIDRKLVLSKLNSLKNEGKIEYELNDDILKIEDIDLDDNEIEKLIELFEKNDIFEDSDGGDYWDNEEPWDDEDEY